MALEHICTRSLIGPPAHLNVVQMYSLERILLTKKQASSSVQCGPKLVTPMDRWPVTLKQSSAVVQNYTIQQIDLHKLQKKKSR
jgi:hypothetical protein